MQIENISLLLNSKQIAFARGKDKKRRFVRKRQAVLHTLTLKGQCHEIFCLILVFSMNQFPPHPRVFHLDRFEFFRKFAEIFASQRAPPVSTTPVANCHRYQRHWRQICQRCRWHRWQKISMATISGCRHLKVNLKAKIYTYVYSATQRYPNKLLKFF